MTEEEDAMKRKKTYVRCAHRASATRFIGQIEAAMDSEDALKLRHIKKSLANKLDVLAKMDDEMLELVDETELESEVEQADEIREKMELAILKIEDNLQSLGLQKNAPRIGKTSHHRRLSNSSESNEEEEEQSPQSGSEPEDPPVTTEMPSSTPTLSATTGESGTIVRP